MNYLCSEHEIVTWGTGGVFVLILMLEKGIFRVNQLISIIFQSNDENIFWSKLRPQWLRLTYSRLDNLGEPLFCRCTRYKINLNIMINETIAFSTNHLKVWRPSPTDILIMLPLTFTFAVIITATRSSRQSLRAKMRWPTDATFAGPRSAGKKIPYSDIRKQFSIE